MRPQVMLNAARDKIEKLVSEVNASSADAESRRRVVELNKVRRMRVYCVHEYVCMCAS